MQSIGRHSQSNRGVGSIIGAVFVALIFLSGFSFYAITLDTTQQYNNTISSMSAIDWDRNQEDIVIKQIAIMGTNQLNVTAENDGSIQSQLIWLGIFNTTASPQNQTYQALNVLLRPGDTTNVISSFAVTSGSIYVIQLVTTLGNTFESKFYSATYSSCALTLIATPPTVNQSNNLTVLLTVTLNDTAANSIQTLTASLSATPSGMMLLMNNSPLTVSGLTGGTTAFFWWIYNATTIGTVILNATYAQAPSGVSALTTINIVAPNTGPQGPAGTNGATWYNGAAAPSNSQGNNNDYYYETSNGYVFQKQSGIWVQIGSIMGATGPTGATGPQGPPGFSTNATFYDMIQNYPFGGAPTTLTPTALGASTCLVYPFEICRNITVTAIYIRSNTVVSNCLLVGIYDSTGTRLYASTALSTVASGWITVTGISVTLASGTYYFGTTNNNVANSGAAYTVTPGIGTATLPRWGSVATSNGALPASITPSSIAKTVGGWMCYVLFSTVTS